MLKKLSIILGLFILIASGYVFYSTQMRLTEVEKCSAQGEQYVYLERRKHCILKEQVIGPLSKDECFKDQSYTFDDSRNICTVRKEVKVLPF